eukprot:gene32135-16660_t
MGTRKSATTDLATKNSATTSSATTYSSTTNFSTTDSATGCSHQKHGFYAHALSSPERFSPAMQAPRPMRVAGRARQLRFRQPTTEQKSLRLLQPKIAVIPIAKPVKEDASRDGLGEDLPLPLTSSPTAEQGSLDDNYAITDEIWDRSSSSSTPSTSGRDPGGLGRSKGYFGGGQPSSMSESQFPWLFTQAAARTLGMEGRSAWADLYDIRTTEERAPNMRRNLHVIEPSLTARAIAVEAERRRPRLQAVEPAQVSSMVLGKDGRAVDEAAEKAVEPAQVSSMVLGKDGRSVDETAEKEFDDPCWVAKQQTHAAYLMFVKDLCAKNLTTPAELQSSAPMLMKDLCAKLDQEFDDPRWVAKQRTHAAYLMFMKDLRAKLVGSEEGPIRADVRQQVDSQLAYQIGITEDWSQVSYMHQVFGSLMGPLTVAASFKHLATLPPAQLPTTAKGHNFASPAERRECRTFYA